MSRREIRHVGNRQARGGARLAHQRAARGFSMIELVIALAIIAIVASIAIPAYEGHVYKARRRDAQAALLGLASAMERRFTLSNTYLGAASGGANTGAPAIYPDQAPLDGDTKYYDLTIHAATVTSYTLRAAPIASTSQASDDCATLTLTSTGVRGSTGTASSCWTQ